MENLEAQLQTIDLNNPDVIYFIKLGSSEKPPHDLEAESAMDIIKEFVGDKDVKVMIVPYDFNVTTLDEEYLAELKDFLGV